MSRHLAVTVELEAQPHLEVVVATLGQRRQASSGLVHRFLPATAATAATHHLQGETAALVDSQLTQPSRTRLQSLLEQQAVLAQELEELRRLAHLARLSLAGLAAAAAQVVERPCHHLSYSPVATETTAAVQAARRVLSGSAPHQRQPLAQRVMAVLASMPREVAAVAHWHSQPQRLRTTPPQS